MKKLNKKKNLTRQYLFSAAYRYLERYATTEANLKFILNRKAARIIYGAENEKEQGEQATLWVEEIVEKCIKNNLINDKLYARARLNSLVSSGNSLPVIKNKLRAKGVSAEVIDEIIEKLRADKPNLNLISAIKYAKKRRFGSFRLREKQDNTDKKESGAMARAGFSYAETKQVLNATREELEDILYEN